MLLLLLRRDLGCLATHLTGTSKRAVDLASEKGHGEVKGGKLLDTVVREVVHVVKALTLVRQSDR